MDLKFNYRCDFSDTYARTIEILAWLDENITNIPHSVMLGSMPSTVAIAAPYKLIPQCLSTTITFKTMEGVAAFKLRWMD